MTQKKDKKEIQYNISIDEITPYDKNYLDHSNNKDFIKKSIDTFDFTTPIEVDENNVILAGHGRYEALKMLGKTEVPTVLKISGWDEKKKTAYRYANNASAIKADIIYDNVAYDMDILGDDYNLEDYGFDYDQSQLDPEEIIEDEAPDVPEIPKTVRGDIYELGNHRVMCGDSTMIDDVEKLMDGKKADMVFTDPPWNVDYGGNLAAGKYKDRKILNDSMETNDFKGFMDEVFQRLSVAINKGCMVYVVMSAQEWGNLMLVLKDNEYHWSSTVIWRKSSLIISRKDYHTQYEPIWYGWKEGAPRLGVLKDRKQSDVWDFDKPSRSELHPTTKPVALVQRAVLNSSSVGVLVVDPFLGSGSTLIACEQTNRKCYGMELDEKYCDVIVQRYVNFTGNEKIKLNGKEITWLKTKA